MTKLYKILRPTAAAVLESGARAFIVRRAGAPRRAENFKIMADIGRAACDGWLYVGETFDGETF